MEERMIDVYEVQGDHLNPVVFRDKAKVIEEIEMHMEEDSCNVITVKKMNVIETWYEKLPENQGY